MSILPTILEVRLHERPIGSLTRLPGNTTAFYFSTDYAEDAQRPTLSLGFMDAYGRLRRPKESSNSEVPPFFANLLPEGDLRRYVAHRAGISTTDEFALLWVTGDDLPGAVTVHDPLGRPLPPRSAGGPEIEPPASDLLRFSLAGVQLKFSAIDNAYGGLTIPAQGRDGHAIVKLPSRHLAGVPENEYAMLQYAVAVGIEVPPARLVALDSIEGLPDEATFRGGQALAIQRFDRGENGTRVHTEDFNQVFRQKPRDKYDNYAFSHICSTVYRVMGNDALIDFVNRLVFNVGIANNDMHLKNWSVIYRDGSTPSLAPAYDYVCTKAYMGHNESGLALGSARDFMRVTIEQFEHMAARAQVSTRLVRTTALAMVARMRDEWPTAKNAISERIGAVIEDQFR
ncbi:MAG: HipA domain-containing protein, partial [Candidatus Eremiobacteraeota bacterium]|nr:HipA domain-containing protein [Candidatus Eremiobacteraeota bacterium]